jgi:hypothetical protein
MQSDEKIRRFSLVVTDRANLMTGVDQDFLPFGRSLAIPVPANGADGAVEKNLHVPDS